MTNLLDAALPGARSNARSEPGQLLIELELSAKSIHHAKAIARECVCMWGLDDVAPDIELVVAELLTNVMRHAAPAAGDCGPKVGRCRLWRVPGAVVVAVHDDDPALPQERDTDLDSIDGRGLLLVRALAADVTVVPGQAGKDVIAVLALDGAADIPEQAVSACGFSGAG